jgi:DNA-directed RNA polymerase specialized sigma24 family protein
MTPHRHHGASRSTYVDPVGRAGADRWARERRTESGRARTLALSAHPDGDTESVCTALQLEDLWDRHGRSVYALAYALLGDERSAAQAVRLGMADLACSVGGASPNHTHRSWARHVYWRSQELTGEASSAPPLPPVMVWLGQLAQLQRACLALCLFGGHSHREAACLLGVPPTTVADLLSAGLREVKRLAADGTAALA